MSKKVSINEGTQALPEGMEVSINALKKRLEEKYPFGIPRKEIGKATGSIFHPRTCANADSIGDGISGRFKIGRNTIYPVVGVMEKIKSKMREV